MTTKRYSSRMLKAAIVLALSFSQLRTFSSSSRCISDTTKKHLEFSQLSTMSSSLPTASRPSKKDKPLFLFVIGLEGTGHHFLNRVLIPLARRMGKVGQRSNLELLQRILYEQEGLLHKFCHDEPSKAIGKQFDEVVYLLQRISSSLSKASSKSNTSLTIALNAGGGKKNMASYPQDLDGCRLLKYPELEVLYHACDKANVECGHIYLYRDPFEIVASTTFRRQFNPFALNAMHLYASMYRVIYAQMAQFPDRNFGCFGLYDQDVPITERWEPIRLLFGFKNRTKFEQHLMSKYRPTADYDRSEILLEMVGEDGSTQMYLDALVRAHELVLNQCRAQTRHINN